MEMMRLNLLWAAGACAGPWLALGGQALKAGATQCGRCTFSSVSRPSSRRSRSGYGSRLSLSRPRHPIRPAILRPAATRWPLAQIPLALLILVFCATGIESSTGGWLAAYAQRLGETAKIDHRCSDRLLGRSA